MSLNTTQISSASISREAVRDAVRDERRVRQEIISEAVRQYPGSRLAKKAQALMLDQEAFDDRVKEAGGDEGFLYFVTAQVASGVSLKALCGHYMLEYGLLWAWMIADEDRLARYEMALRGLADSDISETVELADGADVETVAVSKLQIDTRFKRAAKWDKKRYGDDSKSGTTINLGANSLVAVLSGMGRSDAVEHGATLEGEVVTTAATEPPVLPDNEQVMHHPV